MNRYTYAWGYTSRIQAELALESMFAAAVVSEGEKPEIRPYKTSAGNRLLCITLEGSA